MPATWDTWSRGGSPRTTCIDDGNDRGCRNSGPCYTPGRCELLGFRHPCQEREIPLVTQAEAGVPRSATIRNSLNSKTAQMYLSLESITNSPKETSGSAQQRYLIILPISLLIKIFTHSIHGFSTYIKIYIIERYQNVCTIINYYICGR